MNDYRMEIPIIVPGVVREVDVLAIAAQGNQRGAARLLTRRGLAIVLQEPVQLHRVAERVVSVELLKGKRVTRSCSR